eukprot:TRINITY_DN3696_c0_g1_i1.p1 TRINITY_DN3696_c0_g1~~TRINITY_DN3696_c0_g1_i1.p1  ORF type:complete len:936 (+),score=187.43 TRINITY_DN3696_c0_g1_i1:22-2829(+)
MSYRDESTSSGSGSSSDGLDIALDDVDLDRIAPFDDYDLPLKQPTAFRRAAPYAIGGTLFVLVCIGFIWLVATPVVPPAQKYGLRLDANVVPSKYNILIDTYMEPEFRFTGEEDIYLSVNAPTTQIRLHSLDLEILSVSLVSQSGVSCPGSFKLDVEHEFLVFTCATLPHLQKSETDWILHIEFQAPIYESLEGFYRSSYIEDGVKQWIAVTDFEPANARNAFPCFDEPGMKAVFNFTITAPPSYNVLANMPGSTRELREGGRVTFDFLPTHKQSTYLVCYSVNKFVPVKGTMGGRVQVSVYTQPSKTESAVYAKDAAVRIIEFYERFFGVEYPLPKADLIAIPDFAAGAMENWGLITFRETALLFDPQLSSLSDKKRVLEVVAHELAHQWFGNLVTMEWWDDLWLNEGFATFVEYLGSHHVEPHWHLWELFPSTDLQRALKLDSLASSHPITAHVEDPAEIGELFDGISYAKGGSILRMLRMYLDHVAPNSFQVGLRNYLLDHAEANAETADLWAALSEASELDVAELMSTWTLKMGFPLVKLSESDGKWTVDQHGFGVKDASPLWSVPIHYKTASSNATALLNKKSAALPVTGSPDEYLFLNTGGYGFYRVQYPESMRANIVKVWKADPTHFSTTDKTIFLEDLFALSDAMELNAASIILLCREIPVDSSPLVNNAILSHLYSYTRKLGDPDQLMEKFVLAKYGALFDDLTWLSFNGDYISVTEASITLQYAALFNHAKTIQEALTLAQNYDDPKISVDVKAALYSISVRYGDSAIFDQMLTRYNTATVAAEQRKCLSAIAQTQSPELIDRAIALVLQEESPVRTQDGISLLVRISMASAIGRGKVWEAFRANYDLLLKRYGRSHFALNDMLKQTAVNFVTEERLQEVLHFYQEKGISTQSRAVQQALEILRDNISWVAMNQQTVADALSSKD